MIFLLKENSEIVSTFKNRETFRNFFLLCCCVMILCLQNPFFQCTRPGNSILQFLHAVPTAWWRVSYTIRNKVTCDIFWSCLTIRNLKHYPSCVIGGIYVLHAFLFCYHADPGKHQPFLSSSKQYPLHLKWVWRIILPLSLYLWHVFVFVSVSFFYHEWMSFPCFYHEWTSSPFSRLHTFTMWWFCAFTSFQ